MGNRYGHINGGLTTLEGADTPGKVKALCAKAVRPDPTDSSVPSVGAVCVYNDMVKIARTHLDLFQENLLIETLEVP